MINIDIKSFYDTKNKEAATIRTIKIFGIKLYQYKESTTNNEVVSQFKQPNKTTIKGYNNED